MKVFNSGQGGMICDHCSILIVAGVVESIWQYSISKFYRCQVVIGEGLFEPKFYDFCSKDCIKEYEKDNNVELRICVIGARDEKN